MMKDLDVYTAIMEAPKREINLLDENIREQNIVRKRPDRDECPIPWPIEVYDPIAEVSDGSDSDENWVTYNENDIARKIIDKLQGCNCCPEIFRTLVFEMKDGKYLYGVLEAIRGKTKETDTDDWFIMIQKKML